MAAPPAAATEGPRVPVRHTARDELAARVLDEALTEAPLAPFIPGEPWGLASARAAARIVPDLATALAAIYGVERWDLASFTENVLAGALATWRPGSHVTDDGREVRVRAPCCPLLPDAAQDPRLCHTCQLVQVLLARQMAGVPPHRVRFDGLITHGAGSCTLVLRRS